ncbi:Serine/threonine-protein kinase AfsK [Streptomyces netropsis]|nr:Serine/threonine-protein kinase AfsK [Streptomyces netropsis]
MDSLQPGDPHSLGAYRLLGRLGAGGMGRVYLARSDRGRTVAVKLVQRELAGQEEFRRRFRQEVQSARQVGGEWTAPVLDADTEADIPWVATGYIAGPSLRQVVDRDYGPLPERTVRILGAGLARALQAVHAAGIVHRDLKPSNVLITLDGPRVIDFGIARALETVTDNNLTRTGAAVGSPGFMSPEQVRGAKVTAASDVFCLGAVLAYAATGRMPFGTADSGVHALLYRIAQEEPDLTGVPEPLRPLIADFLAKDPADRPTPEQALERTGVRDLLTDLRSAEPWLPGGIVAQLGRHAVRLLDVEDPAAANPLTQVDPRPEGRPVDLPTVTAGPAAQPLPPANPAPAFAPAPSHQGHPHPGPYGPGPYDSGVYATPPPPERRRSVAPFVLAAVVTAGLLAGGGTVYLLNRETNDEGRGGPGPVTSPTTTPGASGGTSGPSSSGPSASAGAGAPGQAKVTPASGPVPQAFIGTWESDFQTAGGANTRRIVLRQGPVGTTVADISGHGTNEYGTVYRCAWVADLSAAAAAGGPLRLGPSRVTVAEPATSCQPGEATELTLLPDGRLSRRFIGTDKEPLTYTKRS